MDAKTTIKQKHQANFNKAINNSGVGGWYKMVQPTPVLIPWYCVIKFDRQKSGMICRLRFGHCHNRKRLYQIKLVESPNCLNCYSNEHETLEHIINQCPANRREREIMYNKLRKENWKTPPSLLEMLKTENSKTWTHLLNFIFAINRNL